MLKRLEISNYAIIESASIDFSDGLTVITGETGAGKSILLGALGLVLGKRADVAALRDAQKKCIVEAYFDISHYQLEALFRELDMDYAHETIIRREIIPSGKSRAFINDTPCTLQVLDNLAGRLIQIHSQHETLDLAQSGFQLLVLDTIAQNNALLSDYRQAYHRYFDGKRELEELEEKILRAQAEQDYLRFQLDELESADIDGMDAAALENEEKQLTHSGEIKSHLQNAMELLQEGETNAYDMLRRMSGHLSTIAPYLPDAEEWSKRLDACIIELDDIAGEFSRKQSTLHLDPERLEWVQERLSGLYRLMRKHNCQDQASLISYRDEIADRLLKIDAGEEQLQHLKERNATMFNLLISIGKELHERRAGVIKELLQKVHALLGQVGMKDAKLEIALAMTTTPAASGMDQIQFNFTANKGMPARDISKVASGGELSRLMLCIKSLLARSASLPTLLFDEIDTGVSGKVADSVGDIMLQLAEQHQVIAITHLPQIASKGKHHLLVHKYSEEDKTITQIRLLNEGNRVEEIAKMLSGGATGQAALENARQLLDLA